MTLPTIVLITVGVLFFAMFFTALKNYRKSKELTNVGRNILRSFSLLNVQHFWHCPEQREEMPLEGEPLGKK